MNASRKDRVTSMLKRLVSDFLKQEANADALITVTSLDISSDLKNATIRISIYPDGKENGVLPALKKKKKSLREFVMSKTKMKVVPKFQFEIDKGEKNRQKIDKLLYDIKE